MLLSYSNPIQLEKLRPTHPMCDHHVSSKPLFNENFFNAFISILPDSRRITKRIGLR